MWGSGYSPVWNGEEWHDRAISPSLPLLTFPTNSSISCYWCPDSSCPFKDILASLAFSKASLIDTEHRPLEQIKLAGTRCFLKGPWHPFRSFLQLWLVRKVHGTFLFTLVWFIGGREDEGMLQGWVSRGTIICQLGLKYPQLIWHFPSAWATQRDSEENERERERDGGNDTFRGWTCVCRTGHRLPKSFGRNSPWGRWRRPVVVKPKHRHRVNEHARPSLAWYVNLGGERTLQRGVSILAPRLGGLNQNNQWLLTGKLSAGKGQPNLPFLE